VALLSGNGVAYIGKVAVHRARLVLGWVTVSRFSSGVGHLSQYVTSHPGQLSLVIPSWVGVMNTSQRAVTPCGWAVKAGMVRVWVVGKTVIPLLHTGHIW